MAGLLILKRKVLEGRGTLQFGKYETVGESQGVIGGRGTIGPGSSNPGGGGGKPGGGGGHGRGTGGGGGHSGTEGAGGGRAGGGGHLGSFGGGGEDGGDGGGGDGSGGGLGLHGFSHSVHIVHETSSLDTTVVATLVLECISTIKRRVEKYASGIGRELLLPAIFNLFFELY